MENSLSNTIKIRFNGEKSDGAGFHHLSHDHPLTSYSHFLCFLFYCFHHQIFWFCLHCFASQIYFSAWFFYYYCFFFSCSVGGGAPLHRSSFKSLIRMNKNKNYKVVFLRAMRLLNSNVELFSNVSEYFVESVYFYRDLNNLVYFSKEICLW